VLRYFLQETEIELKDAEQSIAEVVSEMAKEKRRVIRNARLSRREDEHVYKIVVEGVGDWVEQTYRPLLKNKMADLRKKAEESEQMPSRELRVYYVNDSRWKDCPDWIDELDSDWEIYLDKSKVDDFNLYEIINPDAVFIATPDSTHSMISQWWLFKTPLIFVEKPFDSHIDNVNELLRKRGRGLSPRDPKGQYDTNVFGLDHWQFYALPIYELRFEIDKHLDGELVEVVFFMTEGRAIELKRDRSLQHGLTLDLLPHLLALLTYFGDIRTVDEIQVFEVGQYEPLYAVNREVSEQENISQRFHAETFSRLRFTFQDYSGTGRHIPCTSEVGKGRIPEKKYLEVKGRNGNVIRVDFKDIKGKPDPEYPNYPYNHLFFIVDDPTIYPADSQLQCVKVSDPYDDQKVRDLFILEHKTDPHRYSRQLDRNRYGKLLDELLAGTSSALVGDDTAAVSTLSLTEGEEIARGLDFIWRAVQNGQGFVKYALPENAYISRE
jgi:predicted dehydrogenase